MKSDSKNNCYGAGEHLKYKVELNFLPLHTDSTNADLGFRCVLPYTGLQVAKKYRVKW